MNWESEEKIGLPTDAGGLRILCDEYGIRPRRERGQHFLVNRLVRQSLIDSAELRSTDTVLEIGAGLGHVTEALAERVQSVLAVEIDRRFIKCLTDQFGSNRRVRIIQDDIRELDLTGLGLADRDYKVVSNLPYNVTSLVIRKLLSEVPRPTRLSLVIQKEVVDRITAPVGDLSLLALSVQFYAEAKLVRRISATSFWPRPLVESSLIVLEPRQAPLAVDEGKYFQAVKAAFAGKRKQLHNSLSRLLNLNPPQTAIWLKQKGIDPASRPQDLALEYWVKIARNIL